ncbi:MAG: hypothetical protein ACYTFI_00850 [Planctomycetota bacterium]|jgi:hypothetical protein
MSEKHWLVRRIASLGGGYSVCRSEKPPHKANSGSWTYAGQPGLWVEQGVEIPAIQTRYGWHIQPGGGPVDISHWFPEGGRRCDNCGWKRADYVCESPHTGHEQGACVNHRKPHWKPHWQPRKHPTGTHPHTVLIDDFPPAIPPGEEGGRTMLQTFEYELWQNEEKVEGETARPRLRLHKGEIQTDEPQGAIRELVIWEKRVLIADKKLTPADVEVISRPFAR